MASYERLNKGPADPRNKNRLRDQPGHTQETPELAPRYRNVESSRTVKLNQLPSPATTDAKGPRIFPLSTSKAAKQGLSYLLTPTTRSKAFWWNRPSGRIRKSLTPQSVEL